jgi:hypothetical protein
LWVAPPRPVGNANGREANTRAHARLTLLQTVNWLKIDNVIQTSKTTTRQKNVIPRNKSIGSRVSEKEYATIDKWVQAEGMTGSDWLMKSIRTYTVVKNNQDLLLDLLKKEQLNFFTTLDFRKKEKIDALIDLLHEI